MSTGKQNPPPGHSSARILNAYVKDLESEVARLHVLKQEARDLTWRVNLDIQIALKRELIKDVKRCLNGASDRASFVTMMPGRLCENTQE